ncbi:MAG TPA: ribonuclease E/G, partial [Allosphingosinicella sp.]
PALIHEDSNLIKRAIRDIYHREIEEVYVEGEDGYRAARAFMKLLMPSHARRVKSYADPVPLFQRYGAEDQLTAMYDPVVQLKSGGYLVINPTEALVSIDINSGRSTREHNIEQTAFATNIEAAHEIARQLRLRDMAGLVVIDFIDMESNGHIRKVERTMKDALKNDRARIQVGRISSFGLMEMSRQRLRTGVLEASTRPCQHCEGTGLMRTAASAGLSALRMIEDEAGRGRGSRIILRAGREAAIYVLNKKRHEIDEVEQRYGVIVEVLIDEALEGAKMSVESFGPPPAQRPRFEPIIEPAVDEEDLVEEMDEDEEEPEADEEDGEEAAESRQPERQQGRERGRDRERDDEGDRGRKRRRRRGRRGGRRRDGEEGGEPSALEPGAMTESEPAEAAPVEEAEPQPAPEPGPEPEAEEKPKARRRPRARRKDEAPADRAEAEAPAASAPEAEPTPAAEPVAAAEEPPAKPKRTRRKKAPEAEAAPAEAPAPEAANDRDSAATVEAESADSGEAAEGGEPRRGWWQRTFGA